MEIVFIGAAVIGIFVCLIQLYLWGQRLRRKKLWHQKADDNQTDLVSVGIVVKGSDVLMVKRANTNLENMLRWQFPSALVKSEQEALKRATEETFLETGIRTKLHRVLGERLHPQTSKYVVYLALTYEDGDPCNGQPEENSEVRWVNIKDARMLLTTNLYEKVDKYLSLFED